MRALQPDDLFELHHIHDARLSPDGRRIAYVCSRTDGAEEFFELFLRDVDSDQPRRLPFTGAAAFPRWSPDGTRLCFIGTENRERQLYVWRTGDDTVQRLTNGPGVGYGAPSWSPDGARVACTVVRYVTPVGARRITKRIFRTENFGIVDQFTSTIAIVSLEDGAIAELDAGVASAVQPAFSPCGQRLLFLGADTIVSRAGYGGLHLFTADLDTGRAVRVLGPPWSIAAAAWLPCGARIAMVAAHQTALAVPTMSLWVVGRDGADPRCCTEGSDGNVGLRVHHDMPTWDTSQSNNICIVADGEWAYATVAVRGAGEIWKIALDGSSRCTRVVTGPRTCVIMDVNRAAGWLLFGASDIHRPWDLYIARLDGSGERRLTSLNDAALKTWPRLAWRRLTFKSSDGQALEGWHVAREDAHGPQPCVLFIHGGPFLCTGHAFRFDFHLLAANGVSVMFANFRGSAGYGMAFARAIIGDWGANAFPDHMAAIDAAVEAGVADPNRLGVWGPSHGGFATAWIVGHTTRFRAAVAESSVTNFSTLYYLCDAPDQFARDLGGRPHEIPDVYRSRSPLTYAWRCRTPTLLLHGEDDLRCPIAEAEQFYRALHDVGCPTELVRITGMNHMGDSGGPLPARFAQNEALLEWFERHL